MMVTTADRAGARAESRDVGDSNTLGRREDRHTPSRTSVFSSFDFLPLEFSERPRIVRRGAELGLPGDDYDGAVRLDLVARDIDRRLAGLLGHAGERRLVRLAGSCAGGLQCLPVG